MQTDQSHVFPNPPPNWKPIIPLWIIFISFSYSFLPLLNVKTEIPMEWILFFLINLGRQIGPTIDSRTKYLSFLWLGQSYTVHSELYSFFVFFSESGTSLLDWGFYFLYGKLGLWYPTGHKFFSAVNSSQKDVKSGCGSTCPADRIPVTYDILASFPDTMEPQSSADAEN